MGHSNLYTIMKEAKYPVATVANTATSTSTHSSTSNIHELQVDPSNHSHLYKVMREAKTTYPMSNTNLTQSSSTHSSLTNISLEQQPSKPPPQHYDFTTMINSNISQQPQQIPHSNLHTIMKEIKDHELASTIPTTTNTRPSSYIESTKKMAPVLPSQSKPQELGHSNLYTIMKEAKYPIGSDSSVSPSITNIEANKVNHHDFVQELGHSNLYTIMKEAKYHVATTTTTTTSSSSRSSITNANNTAAQNQEFIHEQGHSNLYTVMKEAKISAARVATSNENVIVMFNFFKFLMKKKGDIFCVLQT